MGAVGECDKARVGGDCARDGSGVLVYVDDATNALVISHRESIRPVGATTWSD